MKGIHDMGGMSGFGRVDPASNDEVFHADWERRVFAMNLAVGAFLGPADYFRYSMESMDPLHYLAASYYERWLVTIERRASAAGYLSEAEIAAGRAIDKKRPGTPAITPEFARQIANQGGTTLREPGRGEPRFAIGDTVVARTIQTDRHSRLPRYAQGRRGEIIRYHGNHVFADSRAHSDDENPQPLYTVRFRGPDLWGDNSNRKDTVCLDLWEDYLRPLRDGEGQ